MFTFLLLASLAICQTALAKTVTYNWDVTWVWASPDGFGRPVVGINNHFPCPPMEVSFIDPYMFFYAHADRQVWETVSL